MAASSPAAAVDGDWKYEVTVCGWFAGIEGTIGFADRTSQPVEATFDDFVGFLDFAMAGHFEACSSAAVWLADVSYIGLGAERDA